MCVVQSRQGCKTVASWSSPPVVILQWGKGGEPTWRVALNFKSNYWWCWQPQMGSAFVPFISFSYSGHWPCTNAQCSNATAKLRIASLLHPPAMLLLTSPAGKIFLLGHISPESCAFRAPQSHSSCAPATLPQSHLCFLPSENPLQILWNSSCSLHLSSGICPDSFPLLLAEAAPHFGKYPKI